MLEQNDWHIACISVTCVYVAIYMQYIDLAEIAVGIQLAAV